MPHYTAPIDDYRFMLIEALKLEQYRASIPGLAEASPELLEAFLAEGERFCRDVLLPLNMTGDSEGVQFNAGNVTLPKGFVDAYKQYCEGGWPSFSCSQDFGGQGLSEVLNMPMTEMICSVNLSFGITPALTHGAYNALQSHGSDDLKQAYLPKLVSGEWTGTMCLTEAHCGTDLGLIKTTASPQDDGSYHVTGSKIFISGGDHDMTDNIVHMVLAKLPDAPKGARGISLFLVPKCIPDSGEANGVVCGSIEEKMGIHASPTCVMHFDKSVGYLVGEKHKGLRAMFTMMNEARIYVGVQGLGLAEIARQQALDYAKDRLQGRHLKHPSKPEKPADPLTVHPDIRRMLLTMRAYCESGRMLALYTALRSDISRGNGEPAEKQKAADFVAFATPVIKAFMTDEGFTNANLAMQIFGGHGYIKEYGVEQYVRDARIAQIYEGANGIQALDLVGRKLPERAGALLRPFFHDTEAFINMHRNDSDLKSFTKPLHHVMKSARQASMLVAMRGLGNPQEAAAVSYDYMRLIGLALHGYMMCLIAEAAIEAKRNGGLMASAFYDDKLSVARYFMDKILPEHHGLLAKIATGGETIYGCKDTSL